MWIIAEVGQGLKGQHQHSVWTTAGVVRMNDGHTHSVYPVWTLLCQVIGAAHVHFQLVVITMDRATTVMCCCSQVVLVDEVATLLGCVMGLSPLVIGMSLVAMGTSLPDTFCSRTAALKDSHADAAVGNITGSNAANVFLGLGLPWLISSCYYAVRGDRFCSDSGALAFSVLVYSGCAVIWLAVLFARRVYAGGELGAKTTWAKWGLFVLALALWGVYLVLTGLVSDGGLDDSWIASQAGACVSSVS